MNLGNLARVVAVLAAVVAAVGSASSNQNQSQQNQPAYGGYGQSTGNAPPPQQMEAARALGLWRSTFGAVKIEADNSRGGIETGSVHGVWTYQRQGQEIVGYFSGNLRGNVLQFRWQEPNNPPLTGEGYLVFDQQGRQYSGRWWSTRHDRVGDWNGWRNAAGTQHATPDPGSEDPDARPAPDGTRAYGPRRDPRDQRDQREPAPAPYGPAPPPRTYY